MQPISNSIGCEINDDKLNAPLKKVIPGNQKFNKNISFAKATYVAGIAIAWGFIEPNSMLGGLATIVTGVALAGFSHAVGNRVANFYDRRMHRMAKPLLPRLDSKEHENLTQAAFKRVSEHRLYSKIKEIRGIDDLKALDFFKRYINLGTCNGATVELLRKIKELPKSSCVELLRNLNLEAIYYFQCISIMKSVISMKEAQIRKRAWQIVSFKNFSNDFKNLYSPLGNTYPECSDGDKQLLSVIETGKYLKALSIKLEKELSPWKEIESACFSIKKTPEEFEHQWEKLMGDDKEFSGRIALSGNEEVDMKAGRAGHSLTFQVSNGKFRYYDTIDDFFGGFYEYDNVKEFLNTLRNQILSDLNGYQDIIVKFFKADHSEG